MKLWYFLPLFIMACSPATIQILPNQLQPAQSCEPDTRTVNSLQEQLAEEKVQYQRISEAYTGLIREKSNSMPSRAKDVQLFSDKTVLLKFSSQPFIFNNMGCSSNSMSPSFDCTNTLITMQYEDGMPLLIGDIVLFRKGVRDGIIHRIINANNTHILTKGDNNLRDDGWNSKQNVDYVVVAVV